MKVLENKGNNLMVFFYITINFGKKNKHYQGKQGAS